MSEIKERRKRIEREHPGVYEQLLAADPIISKDFTPWLAKLFENGNLLLEDLPKATDYLKLFREHNNHLKHQSLWHYNSLPELYDAVKPFMPKQEGLEEDTPPARSDIITVYEQDGLSVRIPTSESAAQYLGRGTQWCTAYTESPSQFWSYALKGPLLHITTPRVDGKKQRYAVHFNDGQFMDEADKPINLNSLLEKYPTLIPILVPYAKAAIQQNVQALEFVPKLLLTEELCKYLVQTDSFLLEHVPKPLRTPELCRLAVQQEGWALQYVPRALRTPELCKLAVEQNGEALEHVPRPLRTLELCKLALQHNDKLLGYGSSLEYVPERLRTPELYEFAVHQNGRALEYVPEHLRTPELCELALQQNWEALRYFPEPLCTPELCKLAVQNGLGLSSIPKRLLNGDLFNLAVQKNWKELDDVPEHLRTPELCELAVQQNWEALRYVPEHSRTPELCELAMQQNWEALKYFPEHLFPPEQCKLAVQNGLGVNSIPQRLRNRELYKLAVQQSGAALNSVPEHLRTPELCELAVQQNWEALKHVPQSLRTPEICELAVQQNWEALKYVPEHFSTEALCTAAFEKAMHCAEDNKTARSNIIELIDGIPGELHDNLMKKIDIHFDEAGFIQLKPKELAQGIPDTTIHSPMVAGRATGLSGAPPLPG